MALIGMAVFSTEENQKDQYLKKTLKSLLSTVNFNKHRLILSVNSRTKKTDEILKNLINEVHNLYSWSNTHISAQPIHVIYNDTNIGTAEAINKVWKTRLPKENAIKMDDDVEIHYNGWIDEMEEAIRREPKIGQIGLKRKDLIESPTTPDPFYRSELMMLDHKPGEQWIVIEKVNHVMGTCQMYSSALLDKIGYLYQMPDNVYGFDDALASCRSKLAGFINVFLPHIPIDHIDPGTTPFQKWKEKKASEYWEEYQRTVQAYTNHTKSIYYNPFKDGK